MHNCATSIKQTRKQGFHPLFPKMNPRKSFFLTFRGSLIDSHLYFLQMPRDARAMMALLFTVLFQELVKSTDDILLGSLLKVVFAQEAIVVSGNKIYQLFNHGVLLGSLIADCSTRPRIVVTIDEDDGLGALMHGPREEVGNELTIVLLVDLVATCLEVEWG